MITTKCLGHGLVQSSAPRQIDCFTIELGKKTGTTFTITFNLGLGLSSSSFCASTSQLNLHVASCIDGISHECSICGKEFLQKQ